MWNILENLGVAATFLNVHRGGTAKTFWDIVAQICISILQHGREMGVMQTLLVHSVGKGENLLCV